MNKFFKYSDTVSDTFLIKIDPDTWWSRLYEYPYVLRKIKDKECKKVLDAGSGIYHPFRFKLAEEGFETFSCDLEDSSYYSARDGMLSYGYQLEECLYNKIKHTSCDISKMPYEDSFFDGITCISVLEHLPKELLIPTLKEFYRVAKNNGSVTLTMDYSDILPEEIMKIALDSGFTIDGEIDYSIDEQCIKSCPLLFGREIMCFNLDLIKSQ